MKTAHHSDPMKSPLPAPRVLWNAARGAWPGRPLQRFRVDNSGWTNLMLEADGRLMFRFPRWASAARSMGREVRLLDLLGRYLSAPIPHPLLMGTLDQPRGWPFMVYRKIPGTPIASLSSMSRQERWRLTQFLVKLFSDLSGCPTRPLRRLGVQPGDKSSWSRRFRRLQGRYQRVAASHVPPELHRRLTGLFGDFYNTLSASNYRQVLLHGDLWPSHILWNRTSHKPVGVIDWEDARFGDPAFDLTGLQGLGAEFTKDLISKRRSARDASFEQRLFFYRRILPLHGLLFGLETGRVALAHTHLRGLRISLQTESFEAP
jgi:aminoglycoside 2''-phosphotransferase